MWRTWQDNPVVIGMIGGFVLVALVNVLETIGGWLRSRGVPPSRRNW